MCNIKNVYHTFTSTIFYFLFPFLFILVIYTILTLILLEEEEEYERTRALFSVRCGTSDDVEEFPRIRFIPDGLGTGDSDERCRTFTTNGLPTVELHESDEYRRSH